MGKKSGKKSSKKSGKGKVKGGIPTAPSPYAELPEEQRLAGAAAAKAKGNDAFTAGVLDEAEAAFTLAIAYNPADPVLYCNRSAVFTNQNKLSAAIADAKAAISLKPEWWRGYGRLATALRLKGKYAEALSTYAQGIAQDPNNTELQAGLQATQSAMDESATAPDALAAKLGDVDLAKAGDAEADVAAMAPKEIETVVGIDLGTTYSCVGVWRDGAVEIVANSEGKRTTPSVVSFRGDERFVGQAAAQAAASNPLNTVYDAKRLIGGSFADSKVVDDINRFPFKVEEGEGGKPLICVEYQGGEKKFAPEEISAMVLNKMAETASSFLGTKVDKAVVTVPAYFSDSQRVATRNAGTIAGLEVKRIINEPTAAALAYGLDKGSDIKTSGAKRVLVFDLGGGTFDVSLLQIEGGIFEVVATGGDTHLGGEDFDDAIVEFVAEDFRRKHKLNIKESARATRRLRTAVEKAKRILSSSTSATIEVDDLLEGQDLATTLSRAKFEALNKEPFERCMDAVKRVLKDAKSTTDEVNEIVLVGGSTRIPKVQAMLKDFFGGRELCKSINPDEAVAYGAAVQGAILGGVQDSAATGLLLVDVTPLSLGIETSGKLMSTLIKRNTAIPVRKTKTYTTEADYQMQVDIPIYEGERSCTDGNNLLGEFTIDGIERAKKGVPQIEVTFDIDSNGILNVSARDTVTDAKANITISNDRGRLSPEEIERMVKDAAKFKASDDAHVARVEARSALDQMVYRGRSAVKASGGVLAGGRVAEVDAAVEEVANWMESNPLAETKELEQRYRTLERLLSR